MKNRNVRTQLGMLELAIDDNGMGVIDSNARDAFVSGQCHGLAAAIKEKTGWTVKGIGDDFDSPAHCVVWCPQLKRYVDINGTHTYGDLRGEYSWAAPNSKNLVVNPDMSMTLLKGPPRGYVRPDMPAAHAFAKTVLTNLNTKL